MTAGGHDGSAAAAGDASRHAGTPAIVQHTSQRAALLDALGDTPHLVRDRATIALALQYAGLLDDAVDRLGEAEEDEQHRNFARMAALIDKIGGRYLATLERMGMAPGARAATRAGDPMGVGVGADPATAALDVLQRAADAARAAARVDPAAYVDPAVTESDAAD